MRLAAATALILVAVAAPASATRGMRCAPVAGPGPVITMSFGAGLAGVQIEDGRTLLSTGAFVQSRPARRMTVGQSWVDERYLWLDLLDSSSNRYEGRLRATFQPRMRGRPALGSFQRNGRIYRMRCVED
jgi:hypothetical protein